MEIPVEKKSFAWQRLVGVAVSLGVLWLIFRRLDLTALAETLRHVDVFWLLVTMAAFACATSFAAWRWHLMLRLQGATVHPMASVRLVFLSHFFNALLFGPAGGDVAKSALYARWYAQPMPEVLAASVLDRLLGLGGSILLGVLTLALAAIGGGLEVVKKIQAPVSNRTILIAAVVIGVLWWLVRRKPAEQGSFISRTLNSFSRGGAGLFKAPREGAIGMVLGLIVQTFWCSLLAFTLRAVTHAEIPWLNLLWTFPAIAFLASAPITVAGAGVREGASLVLLGLYGVPKTDAVAASLLTLFAYVLFSSLGAVLLWRETQRRQKCAARKTPQTISVVIPALNEAQSLPETLAHLKNVPEICEIIVVDGGSQDETRSLAEAARCTVIQSPPGRGGQLRRGAEAANGDVILLLHADTWVPQQAGHAVLNCLRDVTVVSGGFWKQFRDPSWLMRGSRWRCASRLLLNHRVMGDQGLFIRRDVLAEIGGVPDVPLMEEFELCRKLSQVGRLALAGATVSTSARRFHKRGVLRTYWLMWRVTLLYYLGKKPEELKAIYERG